jgi:DNA mismatch repair ATPase MutS
MIFAVDKQTLDDLNLLGKYRGNSIYNLFDRTKTNGGAKALESMFRHPLVAADAINERSTILKFFQQGKFSFPVKNELCEEVEQYLSMVGPSTMIGSTINILRCKAKQLMSSDKEHEMITEGILSTARLIKQIRMFFELMEASGDTLYCTNRIEEIRSICDKPAMKSLLSGEEDSIHLGFVQQIRYDYYLRHESLQSLKKLLEIIYEIDVLIAVGKVADEKKLHFATALPFKEECNRIEIKNLFHPQLTGAVANSLKFDTNCNLIFLTGANMAGKSTLMKSFGVAIYLGHMGFPVGAEGMEFSVQDGMYTSINVSDNMNEGYSHFYAEVLRVKKVAEEVSRGKNLVIIFDELFKGTNVKDAYDATVSVTEAFGENSNCTYIVSTHIVEAGETLRGRCKNMQFLFFPTVMEKQVPRYTYKLQEGISADRHGMLLISNERILELLDKNLN